jgi:hypothetical protein
MILETKKRVKLQGTGLLNLIDFSVKVQKNFCAQNYKIVEFWQSTSASISDEINKRKSSNSGFNDQELTYMLFNITHAGAILNDQKLNHNEITPDYIATPNDNALDYKLVERLNRGEEVP